ncbi:MAG: 5-formyltetrahydrofolate cyclo-ligase [Firmicutes bacterium]|nr:5-formyltetrahydrofolate cyclo-ligase [Bacillota bacterium]
MDLKIKLRQELLQRRLGLTPQTVEEKSEVIIHRLIDLPEFQSAQAVMTYVSFRHEVSTELLIKQALARGKKVFVPVTDWEQKRLVPSRLLNYPDDLTEARYGLREPKKDRRRPGDPDEIDLVVVPAVAFDRQGYRLGYGAGFYDRFLANLKASTLVIGLSFAQQLVATVCPEAHDRPVTMIITEEGILDFRPKKQDNFSGCRKSTVK